ncbi:MAG TPA: PLP-dependent aminotransferase family protein [Stellaceae bacterium]|jgi:GntR family transcriptional regulator/MocR family aminotransferase|nr:PLP-dependent aminotransferase family protein [Stellaceae bacterium]
MPAAATSLWTTHLDRAGTVPLSRQLAASLRRAIAEGGIGAGARLPSTRALAGELGLARSTIVAVFEQLAAEGFVLARPGSGYYVPARPAPAAETGAPPPSPRPVSREARRLARFNTPRRGEPRPFETGYAEIDGRFMADWKRLAARVLADRSRSQWAYGDPQGEPELRRAIADYLGAARGVRCRAEQIVLTSGTQHGLHLAARVLLDPGDTAWVEDPCYGSAYEILAMAQARIVPVPVDEHGLAIAQSPETAPPRLVYTTPSRQYPLGMAMPYARRVELLEWAESAGAWIVEDDYESEFQAPGRMLPSLQGLDRGGRVIYLGTFSKLVFPSLRLGYAVLPEDLVGPVIAARYLTDRQSSGLIQPILTDFMLGGHFARHLKRMRALYAQRHRFLADAIQRRMDNILRVYPSESGMYLIAWLPADWSDMAAARALAAGGVVAVPLSSLAHGTKRPPGLMLGYTGHSEAAMARAVDRMAEILAAKPV